MSPWQHVRRTLGSWGIALAFLFVALLAVGSAAATGAIVHAQQEARHDQPR